MRFLLVSVFVSLTVLAAIMNCEESKGEETKLLDLLKVSSLLSCQF